MFSSSDIKKSLISFARRVIIWQRLGPLSSTFQQVLFRAPIFTLYIVFNLYCVFWNSSLAMFRLIRHPSHVKFFPLCLNINNIHSLCSLAFQLSGKSQKPSRPPLFPNLLIHYQYARKAKGLIIILLFRGRALCHWHFCSKTQQF